MRKKEKPYNGSLTNKVDLLFGSSPSNEQVSQSTQEISLSSIILPDYQPRQYFDEDKLNKLAQTIEKHGIIEPLLVRPTSSNNGQKFELVAGGRRYRAAKIAKLTTAPVVILNLSDEEALEIAILENLQREDLNPVEETEGILQLLSSKLELDKSQVESLLHRLHNEVKGKVTRNVSGNSESEVIEEVFSNLGITWKSFVETRLPLLKLPEEILEALKEGKLAYTKAVAISKVKDEGKRQDLLTEAIEESLSLSQIKERIRAIKDSDSATPVSPRSEFDATTKKLRAAKLWENPKKWKKAKALLDKLEALLEEQN